MGAAAEGAGADQGEDEMRVEYVWHLEGRPIDVRPGDKPRIRAARGCGGWWCMDAYALGLGDSPAEAFRSWRHNAISRAVRDGGRA